MQLKKQVIQLLRNMEQMTRACPSHELDGLLKEITALRERLNEPLRVAVVGFMKAGKSTLMNAILKEKVLYTGNVETTYRVSWFKYGEQPGLYVVFEDGEIKRAPFEDLGKWTVRDSVKENPRIDQVSYIIVYYPNPILKVMELIDTPGLFSSHEKDARNTMNFLGMEEAKESDRITALEAANADAIVYAFSRGAQGKDAEILEAFQNGGMANSTPVNALGIFTKTDIYWDPVQKPKEDPLLTVAPALEGYKEKLRDRLYDIYPVTAKTAEGFCGMDEEQWGMCRQLAGMGQEDFVDALSDALYFASEDDETIPLPAAGRSKLLGRFGQYGLYVLVNLIREGKPKEEIEEQIWEYSGVDTVSQIIRRHFGNRAFLIKLDYIFNRLWGMASGLCRKGLSATADSMCRRIIEDIDNLIQKEQAFCELKVLQDYYHGHFRFWDEEDEKQFLELTGEYGSGCSARLGMEETASIPKLRKTALERSKHWNSIVNDFGTDPALADAASVIVRTCENLYYHLDILTGHEND